MADSKKTGGRGRQMFNAAVQAGGLVVASSLLAGAVQAKDADKKEKAAAKSKDAGGTMALKSAPNAAPDKAAPGSTMALKSAPNAAADKPAPGSTMAWKLAPNSKAAKAEKVNPPKP